MSGLVVKAVCFDMDDTLYPESEFVLGGLLRLGRSWTLGLGEKTALKLFARYMMSMGLGAFLT